MVHRFFLHWRRLFCTGWIQCESLIQWQPAACIGEKVFCLSSKPSCVLAFYVSVNSLPLKTKMWWKSKQKQHFIDNKNCIERSPTFFCKISLPEIWNLSAKSVVKYVTFMGKNLIPFTQLRLTSFHKSWPFRNWNLVHIPTWQINT